MSLAAHNIFDLKISIPKLISRINFILHPNDKAAEFIELLRETIDDEYGETCVDISFLVEEQVVETQTAIADLHDHADELQSCVATQP